MNKSFQKAVAAFAAVSVLTCILAGCGQKGSDISSVNPAGGSSISIDDAQTPTAVVTDVDLSDAEVHEVIAPQQFTEGEVIDNPYYKRTTDANGTPVFAVIKAGDGQPAYLPFSETTVYHTDSGACYFEKKSLTYKLDGVEKTTTQYELWVADTPLEEVQNGDESASSTSESLADVSAEGSNAVDSLEG